jgi:regulatory protein
LGGTDSKSREPLSGAKLRERALDLLSRRDHSKTELSRKLYQKGGDRDEVQELILEFAERGYLDDRRFAENFVRYRAGKAWGRGRYRQELAKRGVRSDVISEVLQSSPDISENALNEKLLQLIERETRKGKPAEKIAASLARKGFSLPAIRTALGEFDMRAF